MAKSGQLWRLGEDEVEGGREAAGRKERKVVHEGGRSGLREGEEGMLGNRRRRRREERRDAPTTSSAPKERGGK